MNDLSTLLSSYSNHCRFYSARRCDRSRSRRGRQSEQPGTPAERGRRLCSRRRVRWSPSAHCYDRYYLPSEAACFGRPAGGPPFVPEWRSCMKYVTNDATLIQWKRSADWQGMTWPWADLLLLNVEDDKCLNISYCYCRGTGVYKLRVRAFSGSGIVGCFPRGSEGPRSSSYFSSYPIPCTLPLSFEG